MVRARKRGYISDSRGNDDFYRKFTSRADIWVRLSSLDNGGKLESQAKGDRNLSPKIALTKRSEAARMRGILSSFADTFVFIRFASNNRCPVSQIIRRTKCERGNVHRYHLEI